MPMMTDKWGRGQILDNSRRGGKYFGPEANVPKIHLSVYSQMFILESASNTFPPLFS